MRRADATRSCGAVDRLDHRLLGRGWLTLAEQSRQRLQVKPLRDADDVDHQAVLLAGEGAQAAAHQLCVFDLGSGGGGDDHAVHGRLIEALGEHADVHAHPRLARVQVRQGCAPLLEWRSAVERLGQDSGSAELLGHSVRKCDGRHEHERLAAAGVGGVGGQDVPWRGGLLERVAERVGLEVAARLRHPLEVDLL